MRGHPTHSMDNERLRFPLRQTCPIFGHLDAILPIFAILACNLDYYYLLFFFNLIHFILLHIILKESISERMRQMENQFTGHKQGVTVKRGTRACVVRV